MYTEFILSYAKKHGLCTVVDAGCGDFSVGSRLAENFQSYLALDVSPHIIEINKIRFAELVSTRRLTFDVADITATTFPPGQT